MSAVTAAARLREQADALEREAVLEAALVDAKGAYRATPGDEDAKAGLRAAKEALVAARQARRPAVTSVGGDATATSRED